MKLTPTPAGALFIMWLLTGCSNHAGDTMQPVSYVDLNRFMGDWYVIASIPTFAEKGARNPVERYALSEGGTVATTFDFVNKNGDKKSLTAKGFIRDERSNALWGMQFIWPIKADYRIVYLDPDYLTTIVGREKRDYLWIMSRTQPLSEETLEALINVAVDLGYDRELIQLSNWQTDFELKTVEQFPAEEPARSIASGR